MIRAAMIGCGRMGAGPPGLTDDAYAHAPAIRKARDLMFVAVCDVDGGRAQACAERWRVGRWFASVTELLKEAEPELVTICTPDSTHAPILEEVAASPHVSAVLIEKPVAVDLDAALRLTRHMETSRLKVAVNYSRRYLTALVRLREQVARGELGTLQLVSGVYTKGILHNGTHWIDLLRFLVGEVDHVRGFQGSAAFEHDDSFDARLMVRGGLRVTLSACDFREHSVFEMDVIGTLGRARILGSEVLLSRRQASAAFPGYNVLTAESREPTEVEQPTLRALEDLVATVHTEAAPRCTLADGVAAVRIAAAIRKSALSGSEVVALP